MNSGYQELYKIAIERGFVKTHQKDITHYDKRRLENYPLGAFISCLRSSGSWLVLLPKKERIRENYTLQQIIDFNDKKPNFSETHGFHCINQTPEKSSKFLFWNTVTITQRSKDSAIYLYKGWYEKVFLPFCKDYQVNEALGLFGEHLSDFIRFVKGKEVIQVYDNAGFPNRFGRVYLYYPGTDIYYQFKGGAVWVRFGFDSNDWRNKDGVLSRLVEKIGCKLL